MARSSDWQPSFGEPWAHPKYKRRKVDEAIQEEEDCNGDLTNFGEDESEEEQETYENVEPKDAENNLLAFLVQLHLAKGLSAKDFSIISFWASKSGLESFTPYGCPPDASTGNFQKKLDKAMGYETARGLLYEYKVPAYIRQQGKRCKFTNYGVEPWTLVERDMEIEKLTTKVAVQKKALETSLPDNFWQKAEHECNGPPLVPLSLFIDGLSYARKQSMLVIVLHNMLTKRRFLLTTIRKEVVCNCGCSGWCTLASIFHWLSYCFSHFAAAKYPILKHDGSDFDAHDTERLARRGQNMPYKCILLQLRLDWAEWSHSIGVMSWKSKESACPFCTASQTDMKNLQRKCSHHRAPFDMKTAKTYNDACSACIRWVESLTQEQFDVFKSNLRIDRRKAPTRGGLTLTVDMPKMGLQKGDRFEPSANCLDFQDFLDSPAPPTYKIAFWRPKLQTHAKHYCQLAELTPGGLYDLIHVDSMHTLCLGVFLNYCGCAVWHLLELNIFKVTIATRSKENLRSANMEVINNLLHEFTRQYKSSHGKDLTRVPIMYVDKIGTPDQPALHLKASQTVTLLRFLSATMDTFDKWPQQNFWVSAAQSLVQIYDLMGQSGANLTSDVIQDTTKEHHPQFKKLFALHIHTTL
eukprot:6481165-Amphidinium_carterae.2